METTIPFQGFYNSWHDQELDNALENIFTDDHGNVNKELFDEAFSSVDWQTVHFEYAKKFTELFAEKFGLKIKFKLLSSPKYYNFETDRIFCTIDIDEVNRMYDNVKYSDFQKKVKEKFTSGPGFISHYANDYTFWPVNREEWDHNQVGTLLETFIESHEEFDEDWELYMLEYLSETAINLIYEHMKNESVWKQLELNLK